MRMEKWTTAVTAVTAAAAAAAAAAVMRKRVAEGKRVVQVRGVLLTAAAGCYCSKISCIQGGREQTEGEAEGTSPL